MKESKWIKYIDSLFLVQFISVPLICLVQKAYPYRRFFYELGGIDSAPSVETQWEPTTMSGATSLNTLPSHIELSRSRHCPSTWYVPLVQREVIKEVMMFSVHRRPNLQHERRQFDNFARLASSRNFHLSMFTYVPDRRSFYCIPKFYLSFPFAASVHICFSRVQSASSTFPHIVSRTLWAAFSLPCLTSFDLSQRPRLRIPQFHHIYLAATFYCVPVPLVFMIPQTHGCHRTMAADVRPILVCSRPLYALPNTYAYYGV